MGLNYTIAYKKGIAKKVADALSRRGLSEAELSAISLAKPGWLTELQESWHNDELAQQIITNVVAQLEQLEGFSYDNDTIKFNGRLYVGANGELRQKVILELHQKGVGGYSGRQATIKRVEQFFYWPSLRTDVVKLITECLICQQQKNEHLPYPGLL